MTENIISKFTDADILIDEEAYLKIKNYDDSSNLVESLINHITISSPEMVVLTGALVENYLNSTPSPKSYDQMAQSHLLPKEFNFEILKDTSRKSYTNGEIKDLSSYFQNRYHKLKEMLTNKSELKDVTSVKIATSLDDVVKIVGMVNDIRNTKNNHKLIELEDETGDATVLIHNENHEVFEQAERIVKDEVVGVVGSRKGSLIMASEIINPGVPRIDEKSMNFGTVFLSDIHIGSSTFLDSAFQRFIKWINGDFGDEEQREIANNVKYVVVAGDIVDGIGVYPSQDKELTIKDIHQQYEEAARLFGDINDVKIIIAPGNHDASRLAEPQPAIPEDYAKNLHDLKTTEFVSNPALVSLDGIKVLVYHGRSFDDMAMTVKGMSHQQSELIMKELLEKRHLAPIYGERTPLASEIEDHLVIDDIPDVFHTGHVHINSYKKYKGIHLINSGTFQSQTEFQKIYNIVPTCAQVPVINNGSLKMLDFN
ncbi:MAG: DNA-directed DNA polymerase II small subunit [Euryarchaeota archaeon]|jgi:DNA polymerase II small subunit|nr:DNA-directed DNA polymerase II small subunit [Euryarchaeota archaeon]